MSIDAIPATVHPRWTRREALARMASGFGLLAFNGLAVAAPSPLAPKRPHFEPRAKRIIYLVMNGGMSHVDTFDPKPMLTKFNGQPVPGGAPKTERSTGNLFASPFTFSRRGQSGIEVSELFPRTGSMIDDFCVIRSMWTEVPNHEPSLFMFNTGTIQPGRPSLGSWLMYGLGSESQNLPGFVVLCPGMPVVGSPLWSSAFLPAVFQGTYIRNNETDPYKLIRNIRASAPPEQQRRMLDLLAALNREHLAERPGDTQLEASVEAMETAFRMQTEAPEAFDIRQEKAETLARYGDSEIGRSCLLARRLSERGVRMVQVYYGNSQPWDHHEDILEHRTLAARADAAVAALVEDLKQRGMLDETIVVLGTEFGRTPAVENGSNTKLHYGRDHNSLGYSIAVAGGGFKGGITYGATDEFGYRAAEDRVHPHDLNATLLHLLGLDHTRLTWSYSGRDFRLTDVHGEVIHAILA
ncbi:MAG: DUF1501 domain-containing protein [Bryobacteraceae bacterium]|nr:DUF1501 domain-containing protein [Bryobacteraceae bacterium]